MAEKFDVVVIGSGPGGYAAAIRCATRGAKTAIVEKAYAGGTCLNCGCIPSKALLACVHTLLSAKHAAMMGVDIGSATANWPKMQARKDAIVSGFRKGLAGLVKANGVAGFEGTATVTASGKINVDTVNGPVEIEAGKIIIATGSVPVQIPSMPFDGNIIISSKEALSLQQVPGSMVIVGGGVIGCELGCVYAGLGTKVTIVEALDSLIPMEDGWVGQILTREFGKLGIESLTSQKVTSIDTSAGSAKVSLESGTVIEAEKVLISVGRKAFCDQQTIDNLGLETTGPALKVNDKMETSTAGVYAIGDAVGTTYLAHGAFAEAEVAAVNATGGDEKMNEYHLIPRAVYTFPEVASVGRSEKKCAELGIDVTVGKSFFKANGRSVAHNEVTGEIRVLKENATGKIVGVTMVGGIVTELISAARILIGTTEKITEISFPHPTVSEVLKESVEDAFGLSLHNPPKPK